ncbi:acyltransferase family protein [Fibrella arboris]|uniref:acyltransferase family protein n=1 Tax=Fibrella arboris TaxID=3242486 RepID=UPI003521AB0D
MHLPDPTPSLLKTKEHYAILDGLRGVAAVAVVIFHFMEIAVPNYNDSFIAHAYLAVDFFFCLSGFVIAYAYDDKLPDIGIATFLRLRLIRLHPLVIIGSIIGLLVFLFDPFSNIHALYAGKTVQLVVASCLMIPYALVRERYFNIFHLNPPAWSLFWEYVVNVCYALILVKLRNKLLWLLTAIAAVALFYEANKSGNLAVGWSGDNIAGGAIRVSYSFLAGLLIYRSGWIIRSRLGFVTVSILLMAAFLFPYTATSSKLVDPVLVVVYLPFVVALGAGASLNPAFDKLCKAAGELSYPLYMVHYPFIWLFMSYVEAKKPTLPQLAAFIPIGVLLLTGLAYLVMLYVDVPIRSYVKNKIAQPPDA